MVGISNYTNKFYLFIAKHIFSLKDINQNWDDS